MNKYPFSNTSDTLIHQMLFGYSDGHRLIASSIKLSEETISYLLPLSDLSPGVTVTREYGYWTGVPLKSEKLYALMYTWAAPEMPRPGCVWTQILLLPFNDISRITNLSFLKKYFNVVRPLEDLFSYTFPIELSFDFQNSNPNLFLDIRRSVHVLRSVYSQSAFDVMGELGEYDDEIFAVWSQQWPKLRRSFSFRSAIKTNDFSSSMYFFDFCVKTGHSYEESYSSFQEWEVAAAQSLHDPYGYLQKFLWRYGSDIRAGKNKFRILVELFLELHRDRDADKRLFNIVKIINDGFPKIDDARTLKSDLFEGNEYSLITPYSPVEVIRELIGLGYAKDQISFPINSIIEKLKRHWEMYSFNILNLIEYAFSANCYLANVLADEFKEILFQSDFFVLTRQFPNLRKFLIARDPSILGSEGVITLPKAELFSTIEKISILDDQLRIKVISRLLILEDKEISNYISKFYFENLIEASIEFLNNKDQIDLRISRCWIDVIMNNSFLVLDGGYIRRAASTTALAFFASLLSRKSFDLVMTFGVDQWIQGLQNAVDNITSHDRKNFLIFLLKLAFSRPAGSEPLFEFAFREIHEELRLSGLSLDQLYDLQLYLPELDFSLNWDNCLRFKIAVVGAYIFNRLSQASFEKLSSDLDLQSELNYLASNEAGKNYFYGNY